MKLKKMSEMESLFMDMIWSHEEELGLQNCIDEFEQLYGKRMEVATASTYLQRLAKKGYISMHKMGRVYYYTPLITKLEMKQILIDQQVQSIFGKNFESLVSEFCGNEQPSDQLIHKIQEFIRVNHIKDRDTK